MSHEIYKRYRPKTLEEVLGQNETVKILKDMINTNKIPHSIMFTGPSGCGKTTVARILKKALGCSGTDYQEINASDARGIDTIRDMKQKMHLCPMGGKCRIWLLDECQSLAPYAQQALLKPLEDTPDHAYIFLCTTDPNKLLKTIHTRCTELKLTALAANEIDKLLRRVLAKEKLELTDEVIDRLVEVAEGSARKALVLLDQIIGLEEEQEQLEAIMRSDSRQQAIELARTLMDSHCKWPQVAHILKEVEEEPETIRYMILSYARKVLLGGGKLAPRAYLLICAFEESFFNSKQAGLARACWEVITAK